jgi:hypothetical protein
MSELPPIPVPPIPALTIRPCHHRGCALKGISDQSFSRTEARFFLERQAMFPLCYECSNLLKRVVNAAAK